MTFLRKFLAWIAGDSAWLVLLAVAGAAAWLYVEFRQVRADRDELAQWADVTCAASGSAFRSDGDAPNGQDCRKRVAALTKFKDETVESSARTLADALADHDARQLTDNQAARSAASAAQAAAERMEAADADAERRNLVDRDWFAAVNGVAGLRPASD